MPTPASVISGGVDGLADAAEFHQARKKLIGSSLFGRYLVAKRRGKAMLFLASLFYLF